MATRSTPKSQRLFFRIKPARYSTNLLQRDLSRLIAFYQTEGFLNAKIDTVILKTDEKHKAVKLTIKISEGQAVIVRKVHYHFLTDEGADGEAAHACFEPIRPTLALREGRRYRDQALQADREKIIEFEGNKNWRESRFVVGKYITNDLFLSVEQDFSLNRSNELAPKQVFLEYEIARFLFLQAIRGDEKSTGFNLICKIER